ncbi:phosphodiester glycosidase family protein [Luteolibacter sp. SL250]|uniref:phosphodiester glycosidase family protein n=1 Tax=Luteolibacter sp. SL250 TaxID=2995170 RepID=UPI0022703961|nr:phosphodiester glycosidase family protein [Luteolibacter sp. SL250]WAC21817.1 phosphodiester glycosidase family protein [Luteolibacter sp. SL250]
MHLRPMRAAALGVLCLCLIPVACTQAPPLPSAGPPSSAPTGIIRVPAKADETVNSPAPEPIHSPGQPLKVARTNLSGISFEGVAFDSRTHRLAVVDQPSDPGSRFPDAKAAAASRSGLAAFNAGFFTPEGSPLGKLVSAGTPAGSWNRSSLGSGLFQEDSSGVMSLTRRKGEATAGRRELLQAGPLLVENGGVVSGLDGAKPAVRMLIAWDGGSRWWIGRSSSCTLAELGAALRGGSPASWPVRIALNLDGGRSTDLWISSAVPGGPASFRPPWNRPVRNFLVLLPR